MEEGDTDDDSDSEVDEQKLLLHIQRKVAKGRYLCAPKKEQNVMLLVVVTSPSNYFFFRTFI